MKKIISFIASLAALLLVLTACSSKTEAPKKEEKKEPVTVKVASHTSPMTDMLEMIKEEIREFLSEKAVDGKLENHTTDTIAWISWHV